MKIFTLLILVTASTATFQKIKPKKLYKHLVEPFVGAALKDIFTGSLFKPFGLFFDGKKHKHHKGNKDHNIYPPYQYAPFYHNGPDYLYEKNIFYHRGGKPHSGHYGYEGPGLHYGNYDPAHHHDYGIPGHHYGYGEPDHHYGPHQEFSGHFGHLVYPVDGLYEDLHSEFP